jgi:hypothetical protein
MLWGDIGRIQMSLIRYMYDARGLARNGPRFGLYIESQYDIATRLGTVRDRSQQSIWS